MKLLDIVILGLSLAFIVIGIDQTIVLGFKHAYWAFMLALILFFIYNLRKNKKDANKASTEGKTQPSRKRSK